MRSTFKTNIGVILLLAVGTIVIYFFNTKERDELSSHILELKKKNRILSKENNQKNKSLALLSELKSQNSDLKNNLDQMEKELLQKNKEIEKAQNLNHIEEQEPVEESVEKKQGQLTMSSPAFLKAMVPMMLSSVIKTLTKNLELSEDQSTELEKLMTKKSYADIDAMTPMLAMENMSDDESFEKNEPSEEMKRELKEKTDKNLKEYQEKVNNLLSGDQIKKYKKYEFEKLKKNNDNLINWKKDFISTAIPELDENQKKDLYEIYDNVYRVKEENIEIGDSLSDFSNGSENDKYLTIEEDIINALTYEQLEKIKKHKDVIFKKSSE